jgi:carbon-monoxide dehydrogenase medium subunit
VIPAPLAYVRPASLDEALEALGEPDARALAGGQSLLPVLKLRVARPSRLVDIGRLGLDGMELSDGELRLGALVTWDRLLQDGTPMLPALAAIDDCARHVGDLQVRNRGTIGGSLAHADPASDLPAVVLALGARLVLRSAGEERSVEARDFFLGPFTTALRQGELLTEIVVPVAAGAGSAYVKVEHPASGFALAGAAALVHDDGSSVVALTGVGGHATIVPDDGALEGVEIYGDRFAPEEYRRHLAGVVVRRAVDEATARRARER